MAWIDAMLAQPATAEAARDQFRRAVRTGVIQGGLMLALMIGLAALAPEALRSTSPFVLVAALYFVGASAYAALDAKSAYHRLKD